MFINSPHTAAFTLAALAFSCPLAAQAQPEATASTTASTSVSSVLDRKNYGNSAARFASGTGNILYLAAGTLLPLLEDGPDGKEHSLRTADSLLTSTLITEALKHIVREKRPGASTERTSFPSGHATAAFAVATMESQYHPKQALYWYGGATLIAASRVQLHRHYVHDVLAGAAVGYFTSRFELKRPHGLILAPFIKSHQAGGGNGVSVSLRF